MWDVEAANNHDTKLTVIPLLDRGIQKNKPQINADLTASSQTTRRCEERSDEAIQR
jgi:hypothetical protein